MSGEYLQASEANHKNQKIKTSAICFLGFFVFLFFSIETARLKSERPVYRLAEIYSV